MYITLYKNRDYRSILYSIVKKNNQENKRFHQPSHLTLLRFVTRKTKYFHFFIPCKESLKWVYRRYLTASWVVCFGKFVDLIHSTVFDELQCDLVCMISFRLFLWHLRQHFDFRKFGNAYFRIWHIWHEESIENNSWLSVFGIQESNLALGLWGLVKSLLASSEDVSDIFRVVQLTVCRVTCPWVCVWEGVFYHLLWLVKCFVSPLVLQCWYESWPLYTWIYRYYSEYII